MRKVKINLSFVMMWGPVLAATFVAQAVLTVGMAHGPVGGLNVDDAMHALAGASVLHDLVHLDFRSLLVDLWDQGRWPPLGSVLQLPTLAVLGISAAGHRMAILVLLLPTVVVMAAAAKGMVEEEDGPWAMVIVGGLALSSGVLLITSASVLYEVPGMAVVIGAYLAANEGWKTRKAGWFWLGSVLLAAAWFTKWQYGIVATVALLAAGIVRKRRGEEGVAAGDFLYVVPIVTLVVWFLSAYHVREFGLYMLWQPSSLGKLSRYAMQYGGAAVHGGWVTRINVALTFVGLALAGPIVLRTPLGVALATHVMVAALGSGSKDMSDRIGLWIVLPAWVLAGAGWARFVGRRGEWAKKAAGPLAVGAIVILVAGGSATRQVHLMHGWHAYGGDWYEPEAQYVAETVPLGARLATIGGWRRYISPFHIRWQILRLHWDERYSQRRARIVESPSLDWMPWLIRWSDPRAVFALRRAAARPEREIVPPQYVAILRLQDGTDPKALAYQTAWMRGVVTMAKVAEKDFPSGSKVEIYKCEPAAGALPPAPP
jgi:hypothetical protein